VRVGIRFVAIKATAFRKLDFQDFTYLLEQGNGFVDGGQTGGGKGLLYLLIDALDTGMIFAGRQDFEYRQPLRRDPEIMSLKFGNHLLETNLWVGHNNILIININYLKRIIINNNIIAMKSLSILFLRVSA
jgi:hypothetical protein